MNFDHEHTPQEVVDRVVTAVVCEVKFLDISDPDDPGTTHEMMQIDPSGEPALTIRFGPHGAGLAIFRGPNDEFQHVSLTILEGNRILGELVRRRG